ncbi:MAG TPA: hypothetical protein VI564_02640 [Candidatus Nanoarchaeia archaeon]|nr:hypothetical protein [Candidatus Nanoarchaeia archaeon]
MKKKNIIWALLALYLTIVMFSYVVNLFTDFIPVNLWFIWINAVYLTSPTVAVLAGIYVLRKYGIKGVHGRSLLFIELSMAAFLIGEFTWMLYEIFLGEKPFPSIADLFYSVAYPLIMVGVIIGLKLGKINWTKKRLFLTVSAIIVLSVITLYYGIIAAYDQGATLLENSLSIGYVVLDIPIIIGMVLLVNLALEFRGGAFSGAWVLMAIGMLGRWISDILFAYFYNQYSGGLIGGTAAYRMIDFGWMANYLLTALVFIRQGIALENMDGIVLSKFKTPKGIKTK